MSTLLESMPKNRSASEVACPKCKAEAGEKCLTKSGKAKYKSCMERRKLVQRAIKAENPIAKLKAMGKKGAYVVPMFSK